MGGKLLSVFRRICLRMALAAMILGLGAFGIKWSPVVAYDYSACPGYEIPGKITATTPTPVSAKLWSWGWNAYSQLGDGLTIDGLTPVQVKKPTDVVAISSGYQHSLAVKSDGSVWAWGGNQYGQLGDGTTEDRAAPIQVQGLNQVVAVAAGEGHSLALGSNGSVWAWGSNSSGQLGDGTAGDRLTPIQVQGLAGVAALSAGGWHSLALGSDGAVWSWGRNESGQLGDGSTETRLTPARVRYLDGVVAVAAGWARSLALKSDGTVWSWGSGISEPKQVPELSGVVAVAEGGWHSLAVRGDGTVWTWGSDLFGGLLDDEPIFDQSTPVRVYGLEDVIDVEAGLFSSSALKSDGTIWTWGLNYEGELGDGTTVSRSAPAQVLGLSNVRSVKGGAGHFLALVSDAGGPAPTPTTVPVATATPTPTPIEPPPPGQRPVGGVAEPLLSTKLEASQNTPHPDAALNGFFIARVIAGDTLPAAATLVCLLLFAAVVQLLPAVSKPSISRAAIVDQLSLTFPNPAFVAEATTLMKEASYIVDYYPNEMVTVDLYRRLPTFGHRLIILRVHSPRLRQPDGKLGSEVILLSGEPYDEKKYSKPNEKRYLAIPSGPTLDEHDLLFMRLGITDAYTLRVMEGRFRDAIIVMMGCSGLRAEGMAKALLAKGAAAVIGWDGEITGNHTDAATLALLRRLLVEKIPVKRAVVDTAQEVGPDPQYGGKLTYYPPQMPDNLTVCSR